MEEIPGRSGFATCLLTEGPLKSWTVTPDQPEVSAQGAVRKHDDFWIVTLFLVNNQKEPKKNRDAAWLFQAELNVAGTNEQPIFRKRVQAHEPGQMDSLDYYEKQAMNMLYRDHVEFGVGHGVAVHAEAFPENPQYAIRLSILIEVEMLHFSPQRRRGRKGTTMGSLLSFFATFAALR